MTLHVGHCSASDGDSWRPGILACRCRFEVADLGNANLFREAQNLPIMRANLANAMTIIRECKAPAKIKKFLHNMFIRIEIPSCGD